jgi:hypothetical protein
LLRGIHATCASFIGLRTAFPAGSFWLPATCLATPHLSAAGEGTLGESPILQTPLLLVLDLEFGKSRNEKKEEAQPA